MAAHASVRRCIPPVPVRVVENFGDGDLLDASLALASTQLVGQLADETSLDARTMGTLGFAGALLAIAVAAKDVLGAAWWAPVVVIVFAVGCCLSPTLGIGFGFAQSTDLGPDPAELYATYEGGTPAAGRMQLLADLRAASTRNARRLLAKQRALRAAVVILAVGLPASALVVGVERPATLRIADVRQAS